MLTQRARAAPISARLGRGGRHTQQSGGVQLGTNGASEAHRGRSAAQEAGHALPWLVVEGVPA